MIKFNSSRSLFILMSVLQERRVFRGTQRTMENGEKTEMMIKQSRIVVRFVDENKVRT